MEKENKENKENKEKEDKMNTKKDKKEPKERKNKIKKEKLDKFRNKKNKKNKDSEKAKKLKLTKTKGKGKTISREKLSMILVLIITIILALALFLNLAIRRDVIFNFDLTYSKMYRLTNESKQIIKNVDEPVEINIDSSLQYVQITEVLDEVVKLNDFITLTYRDSGADDSDEEDQLYYTTIFVSATEREDVSISFFDLNFDSSLIDGKTFKQYTLLEEKLVNAIISVTNDETPENPSVAFLTGLDGSSIEEELINLYTELRSFGVFPIELDLKKDNIPESVKIIGIVGPMKDINKTEYNKLIDFQARGGNFVIGATFVEENTHSNFKKLLSSYGVQLPVGGVLDYKDGYRYSFMQSTGIIRNYNNILLPIATSDNDLTKDMVFEGTAPFFIFPTQIVLDSEKKLAEKNLTYTNHIITSDMAVFKSQDIKESDITDNKIPPDAMPNIYVLGTIVEKKLAESIKSKAVIYSNYLFMTDLIIQDLVEDEIILQKDNLRLAKNSFTYLHPLKGEMVDIKKGLVISPYKYDSSTIVLHKVITYVLFIVPMLLIISSGVVMSYRRGRLEKIGLAYKKKGKNN